MATEGTVPARVRASVMKDQWAYTQDALGERVKELTDPGFLEVVKRLEATPRLAWCPVTDFDRMAMAIHGLVGNEGYRAITRRNALGVGRSQLFEGVVTTIRTLFGVGPAMLLRAFPTGFSVLYSNFGNAELTVSDDRPEATMRIVGVDPVHMHRAALEGLAGAFEAFVEAMDARPVVTIDESRVQDRVVTFHIRW